jgi:hypothetical protein
MNASVMAARTITIARITTSILFSRPHSYKFNMLFTEGKDAYKKTAENGSFIFCHCPFKRLRG